MGLIMKKRCAEMLPAKRLGVLPPGWHPDGRGLYLLVTPAGSRRWVLRTMVKAAGGANLALEACTMFR